MNPDHDSKPLLHDVLHSDQDALRATSLEQVLGECRRTQRTKQHIRRAGVVAALLTVVCVGLLLPRVNHNDVTGKTNPRAASPAHLVTVHQLSDAELRDRLEKFAVAYVGEATNKRIVMIEPWTR